MDDEEQAAQLEEKKVYADEEERKLVSMHWLHSVNLQNTQSAEIAARLYQSKLIFPMAHISSPSAIGTFNRSKSMIGKSQTSSAYVTQNSWGMPSRP